MQKMNAATKHITEQTHATFPVLFSVDIPFLFHAPLIELRMSFLHSVFSNSATAVTKFSLLKFLNLYHNNYYFLFHNKLKILLTEFNKKLCYNKYKKI